jgi:hypothetical protein
MITLHIEHAVSDFATWAAAFDRFASFRIESDVRGHSIRRPYDHQAYVVLDLHFDDVLTAQRFLDFLQARVWTTRQNSPALVGAPRTSILETVEHHQDAHPAGLGRSQSV